MKRRSKELCYTWFVRLLKMGSFLFYGNGLWFMRLLVGERVLYLLQEII